MIFNVILNLILLYREGGAKPVYRMCQTCYQAQQAKETFDVVCDEVGIDGSEQYDSVTRGAFVPMKNDVNPPEPVCHGSPIMSAYRASLC